MNSQCNLDSQVKVRRFFSVSLTMRYIVALAILGVFAVILYYSLSKATRELTNLGEVINQTGRQRMLTQRIIVKTFFLITSNDSSKRDDALIDLQQSIDEMVHSHEALSCDSCIEKLPPEDAEMARDFYHLSPHDLDRKIEKFISVAQKIVFNQYDEAPWNDEDFNALLILGENLIVDELDVLVMNFQKNTGRRIEALQHMALVTLVVGFVFLFAVGAFIFRPMVKKILNNMSKLNLLNIELERLACRDHLTGAFNRLRFEEILEHELLRLKRFNDVFSVFVVDIDFFKRINDTYGHRIGDEVLKDLVVIMNSELRELDSLVRYGGEEFVVLLPRTEITGAIMLAERLRAKVESHKFINDISVTISLGVTSGREDDSNDTVIARADAALYSAKRSGRNMVFSG